MMLSLRFLAALAEVRCATIAIGAPSAVYIPIMLLCLDTLGPVIDVL